MLTGYWTLVSQDTTLLHSIWIALSNYHTVEEKGGRQQNILLWNEFSEFVGSHFGILVGMQRKDFLDFLFCIASVCLV